jgi:hypothetical protein
MSPSINRLDLGKVRAEIRLTSLNLEAIPHTIANTKLLRHIADTKPNSQYCLWECSESTLSPIKNAVQTLNAIDEVLGNRSDLSPILSAREAIEPQMQKLSTLINKFHTIRSFACTLMLAIAYNNQVAKDYGDVADYINDHLSSAVLELDDLKTEIGHRLI